MCDELVMVAGISYSQPRMFEKERETLPYSGYPSRLRERRDVVTADVFCFKVISQLRESPLVEIFGEVRFILISEKPVAHQ